MTILEMFMLIPVMFYLSAISLPIMLFGYFTYSKPKKRILAKSANPADTLKEQKVDAKRESTSAMFLGATIAFGAGLLISMGWLVNDYKNSERLFAESLPAASYPPTIEDPVPPAPSDEPIKAVPSSSDPEE